MPWRKRSGEQISAIGSAMVRRFSLSARNRQTDGRLSSKSITKSGHMVKSPPSSKVKFSSWKRRYFVLYDPTMEDNKFQDQTRYLIYYKTKENTIPVKKINLENATVAEGTPINNNQWVINLTTKDRLYYLCPETEVDYYAWWDALKSTIETQPSDGGQRRDSLMDMLEATSPVSKKQPPSEKNYKLRDELDRMKLERDQLDPQGSVSTPVGSETLLKEFEFKQPNSNKDSGIETGDEAAASSKDYDQVPTMPRPYIHQHPEADQYQQHPQYNITGHSGGETDVIYGNLIQDVEPPNRESLPPKPKSVSQQQDLPSHKLQQDDIYDKPPPTRLTSQQENQTLTQDNIYSEPPSRVINPAGGDNRTQEQEQQPQLTQDDIYDHPPVRSPQTLNPTTDNIYDHPPSNSGLAQLANNPATETPSTEEIYDCPPSNRGSVKRPNQLPLCNSTDDETYDSPSSNSQAGFHRQSPVATQQQKGFNTQENLENVAEDIYEAPDQPIVITPQKGFNTGKNDIYEAPDQTSHELYDTPKLNSINGLHKQDVDDIYEAPDQTSHELYDTPKSNSINRLHKQDVDDIYEAPDQTGQEIYECPESRQQLDRQASETYTTMNAIHDEISNKLNNAIYSNPPVATQEDIYDTPPPQRGATGRTSSETIQMKSLPNTPAAASYDIIPSRKSSNKSLTPRHSNDSSRHNSFQRTHSEVIQSKDLPPEPSKTIPLSRKSSNKSLTPRHSNDSSRHNSFQRTHSEVIQSKDLPPEPPTTIPLTQDDIYDTPSSKTAGYQSSQYQHQNNNNHQDDVYETFQSVSSSQTFDRSLGGGQFLPQGYEVTNNNDDVYDAIPNFANKPLPTSPRVMESQKGNFQQNGKIFQQFSYR